jgi:hypothetical protein
MGRKSLAQLRAKTDRELAILVTQQLLRSKTLAHLGEYREAADVYLLAAQLLKVTAPAEAARVEHLRVEVRELVELPIVAIA